MAILYLTSTYPLIYDYLDRKVVEAFTEMNSDILLYEAHQPIEQLEGILKLSSRPSVAFTLLGDHLSERVLQMLKNAGVKLAVWLTEDPYYIDQTLQKLPLYDYVFTIDRGAFKFYQSAGFSHIFHLPLATDPTTFTEQKVDSYYKSDVTLVGYPYPARIRLVEYLILNGSFSITVIGKQWYNLLSKPLRRSAFLKIFNQWVEPEEIVRFYNGAKIILNPHRQADFPYNKNKENIQNETINNRTFDIAAAGAFQLIEGISGVPDYFSMDEMITYQHPSDCIEKIHYYLEDRDIRQKIAKKAQIKVLKEHTFKDRAKEIIDVLKR